MVNGSRPLPYSPRSSILRDGFRAEIFRGGGRWASAPRPPVVLGLVGSNESEFRDETSLVRGGGSALDFVQTYGRRTSSLAHRCSAHVWSPEEFPGCGYLYTYVRAWHPAVRIPSGTLAVSNLVRGVRRWVFPPATVWAARWWLVCRHPADRIPLWDVVRAELRFVSVVDGLCPPAHRMPARRFRSISKQIVLARRHSMGSIPLGTFPVPNLGSRRWSMGLSPRPPYAREKI